MGEAKYIGPLHEMACTTITDLWNDSCSIDELTFSVAHGAVGATTNPSIVVYVLTKEMHLWKDRIRAIALENPTFTDDEVAIQLNKEMAVKGAEILRPVFDREHGKKGRISIQTMAKYYRDPKRLFEQACEFAALAPNMQVKIPVTKAGIWAIEEATYAGVSINATVSFTVPQSIAVAEAVERGLRRREAEGKDIATMSPVCTVMCGRLDDWLKSVAEKQDIIVDPACFEWAGVAAMKRSYEIYRERGYRLRLLSAAYRNHMHWSEFIGGDAIVSIPFKWQQRYNASDVPCVSRIDTPVPKAYLDVLLNKFADFRRAYEDDGMAPEEFDSYGATARTLRQFIEAYEQLVGIVRNIMLPNPDK